MSMKAGKLRDRIEILRKSKTSDGMGGYQTTEASLLVCWAQIEILRVGEAVVAGADSEVWTHQIRIRDPMDAAKRPAKGDAISWDGYRLSVVNAPPDGSGVLTMQCSKES